MLRAFLANKRPAVGADTRVTLIAADALLSGVHDHPVRFAARLAATHVRGAGEAIRHTRKALRAGVAWWRAGASNSAGAAAAARSPAFGLLWSDDPVAGSLRGRTLRDRHPWPSGRDRRCRRLRRRHRARREGEGPARQPVAGRCGGHLQRIPSGRCLRRHRGGPDSADPEHPPRRPD